MIRLGAVFKVFFFCLKSFTRFCFHFISDWFNIGLAFCLHETTFISYRIDLMFTHCNYIFLRDANKKTTSRKKNKDGTASNGQSTRPNSHNRNEVNLSKIFSGPPLLHTFDHSSMDYPISPSANQMLWPVDLAIKQGEPGSSLIDKWINKSFVVQ